MITIVSMNPSIDMTLFIPRLTIGGSHRVRRTRRDISGKAVNTAYALRNLNQPCQLLGFDFIENGNLLKESLKQADIPYDFVSVNGSIRTNTKIFEEECQRMTEINQEGFPVSEESVGALFHKVIQSKSDVLILSGSLPQGVDKGIYGEMIRRIKAKDEAKTTKTKVILDADGPAMHAGLEAGPYMIKPNHQEMERLVGESLPSRSLQISAGRDLLRKYGGIELICLSLGGEGALMIGKEEALFAPPLDIKVRGIQGAGDAMVAGLAFKLFEFFYLSSSLVSINKPVLSNSSLSELFKSAVAAAAASLVREGTLMCTREGFDEMIEKVEIEKV